MLRFIKEHMSTIDGIEIFPIISLLIFVTFFTVLIWGVIKLKKSKIDTLKNYPLEED